MATGGGRFSTSVIQASDIIYDFSCSPCTEKGKNTEALYKCIDCQTFLCVKCYDGHIQFVKGHRILDVNENEGGSRVIQSKDYTCEEHQGKFIDMYCRSHDKVCCSVCLLNHRKCKGVSYIPDVAKTLLKANNKDEIKKSLKSQCTTLRKLKSKMVKGLNKLLNEKGGLIKDIKQFKEEIIEKAEKLEQSSLKEVEEKYQAIIDDVNLNVRNMDQLLIDNEKYLSKIEGDKFDDDRDEVVTLKLSKQHLKKRGMRLLQLKCHTVEQVNFQPDTRIEECLSTESFGHLQVSSRLLNSVCFRDFDGKLLTNGSSAIRKLCSLLHEEGISTLPNTMGVNHGYNYYAPAIHVVGDEYEIYRIIETLKRRNDKRCKDVLLCLLNRERIGHIMSKDILLRFFFMYSTGLTKNKVEEYCKDVDCPYVCIDMNNESYDQENSKAFQLIRDILLE